MKDKKVTRAPREIAIAPPEETADVKFREGGAVSPYRDLLEDLQDAPKGSTLRIARAARYTAVKHIRDLGLDVRWGRDPKNREVLYIKIVGEKEPPLTIERAVQQAVKEGNATRAAAAVRETSEQSMLLRMLQAGPQTLRKLAGGLGVTASACATALTPLVDSGRVEVEDGCYRIKAA